MTVDTLYKEANAYNIDIVDWNQGTLKAATISLDNDYCIFVNKDNIETYTEEKCILAHEIGHCRTGSVQHVLSPFDLIEKHEYLADKYAVNKLIPKNKLKNAVKKGVTEVWQLADYFGVTEDFMRRAVYLHSLTDKV